MKQLLLLLIIYLYFAPVNVGAEGFGKDTKIHRLGAQHDIFLFFEPLGQENAVDIFLNSLQPALAQSLSHDIEFQETNRKAIDSNSLLLIANELLARGHTEEASQAYEESLKLNNNNLQAHLALANISNDNSKKLEHYLASINTDALTAIAEIWLDTGLKNLDPQGIASAFVSYQYAILKEPLNPILRFKYAQALEKSGQTHYAESSKRYLEAASLAKKEFITGNFKNKNLLRNSIESLVQLLSSQGDFKNADKYCSSYIKLGFKNFIQGDDIKKIQEELRKQQNPFKDKA